MAQSTQFLLDILTLTLELLFDQPMANGESVVKKCIYIFFAITVCLKKKIHHQKTTKFSHMLFQTCMHFFIL